MSTRSNVVVIQGPTASGKTMLAELLMSHYQKLNVSALFVEGEHTQDAQLQHLVESDHFDYIIVTRLNNCGLKAPCLVKPYQTITISG